MCFGTTRGFKPLCEGRQQCTLVLLGLKNKLCFVCRFWSLTLAVRCIYGMERKWHWHRGRWPFSWPSTCGTAPLTTPTVTSTRSTRESATHSYPSMKTFSIVHVWWFDDVYTSTPSYVICCHWWHLFKRAWRDITPSPAVAASLLASLWQSWLLSQCHLPFHLTEILKSMNTPNLFTASPIYQVIK